MYTSSFPGWLADALAALTSGDVDGWMGMYAEDGVHEFPCAPGGGVRRLAGRAAIAEYIGAMVHDGPLRLGSLHDIRTREVGDETVVEFTGNHHRKSDGAPVTVDYVWFLTRHDGLVTQFRDYMNPLQLSQAGDADTSPRALR